MNGIDPEKRNRRKLSKVGFCKRFGTFHTICIQRTPPKGPLDNVARSLPELMPQLNSFSGLAALNDTQASGY